MENLIDFSRKYGSDVELVAAGGGNTSMKENGVLYVKKSGKPLAEAEMDSFISLDMEKLLSIVGKAYPKSDSEREAAFLADVMAAVLPGQSGRPSVEVLLHALFPQKYVLHLHPALVNGLTCAVNGESEARRLFGDDFLWIPACRPGHTLAVSLADKITSETDTVLLQNHGVFFAADTPGELGELLESMLETIKTAVHEAPDIVHTAPLFNNSSAALKFSESCESAGILMKPFTPDQIVYCGPYPSFVLGLEDWDGAGVAIVKGQGFYASSENAMLLFEDAVKIAVYSQSFGGPLPLSEELINFIINWEAESYRKSQSR
ncbi:MAG: class II aldolase/adducin family protein [Oscillospiraceae bacterium]